MTIGASPQEAHIDYYDGACRYADNTKEIRPVDFMSLRQTLNEKEVRKVLDTIDEEELVSLCRDLIRIPSVSGQERAIAEFIFKRLNEWGFDVKKYDVTEDRSNVVGRVKGRIGTPSLMLNGHMDTVPPGDMTIDPFGAEVKNGKIYGRGAADTKGGLAAMLMASKIVKESGIELAGDLIIASVVDEEKRGLGTSHLAKSKLSAQYGIIFEPTSLDVVLAHKGQSLIELVVKGKAAHGSRPEEGVNAIYQMMKAVNEILVYSEKFKNKTHPLLGHPTLSVNTIQGGATHATVPDKCHIEIDRRLLPGETTQSALEEINMVLSEMKKKDATFDYELFLTKGFSLEYGNGLNCSPDEPVVKALLAAGDTVLGKKLAFKGLTGTTDGAIMSAPPLNIKTVVFGPGGGAGGPHTADEHLDIRQLVDATKILTITILELLGT